MTDLPPARPRQPDAMEVTPGGTTIRVHRHGADDGRPVVGARVSLLEGGPPAAASRVVRPIARLDPVSSQRKPSGGYRDAAFRHRRLRTRPTAGRRRDLRAPTSGPGDGPPVPHPPPTHQPVAPASVGPTWRSSACTGRQAARDPQLDHRPGHPATRPRLAADSRHYLEGVHRPDPVEVPGTSHLPGRPGRIGKIELYADCSPSGVPSRPATPEAGHDQYRPRPVHSRQVGEGPEGVQAR